MKRMNRRMFLSVFASLVALASPVVATDDPKPVVPDPKPVADPPIIGSWDGAVRQLQCESWACNQTEPERFRLFRRR